MRTCCDDPLKLARASGQPALEGTEGLRVSAGTSRRVSCDAVGQAALEGMEGLHVSAETSRRLACDAATVVMRHGRAGRVPLIGCGPQAADHLTRAAPGTDHPGPRVPLSRLSGAPLRRPSCPALGRGWGDPARQPGAALPAAPPRGARGGLHRHARPRRHGALLPARRPAAPGRAASPALGRSAARTDLGQTECRRHHDRRRDRAAALARRTPRRGLGDRRPLEAATDGGGLCDR